MTHPSPSPVTPARGEKRITCPHCGPLGPLEEHDTTCPRFPLSKREPVTDDGLVERDELTGILRERCDENFDGECHLTNAEADRIITFLARAALAASDRDVLVKTIEKQAAAIAFAHKTLVELKIARTLNVDFRAGGAASAVSKVVNTLRTALIPLAGEL